MSVEEFAQYALSGIAWLGHSMEAIAWTVVVCGCFYCIDIGLSWYARWAKRRKKR